MSNLVFSQPARSNLLVPVLIAFLVLGIILAVVLLNMPRTDTDASISHTAVVPIHTVFKSESTIVGRDQSQDDLYVLTTVHVADNLRLPIFIKDFSATLTTAEGEELTTSAIQKIDLPNVYLTFPKLKPLASEPLARETLIAPGQHADGMVLLHFPITEATWDHRRSATLTIDFYHQSPVTLTIPPSATPNPDSPYKLQVSTGVTFS